MNNFYTNRKYFSIMSKFWFFRGKKYLLHNLSATALLEGVIFPPTSPSHLRNKWGKLKVTLRKNITKYRVIYYFIWKYS